MSKADLYRSTRAWWKLSPRTVERLEIRHAVPVFEGVTRALYRIQRWKQHPESGRWAFEGRKIDNGELFDEVVGLAGHRVPFTRHSQNPINYWPKA
jgi:hypothetical protein